MTSAVYRCVGDDRHMKGRTKMRIRSTVTKLCAALLVSTVPSWGMAETRPERTVEIRWTRLGVPHIKAADYESLGFGYGYALAGDRYCELAGRALTFRGERSRWYGADAGITIGFLKMTNLTSDILYRTQFPDALIQRALDVLQPKTKEYLRGFVAGLNRYVSTLSADEKTRLCGGIHIPTFKDSDIARSLLSLMVISKGFEIGPEMLTSGTAWSNAGRSAEAQAITPVSIEAGFGSNAWAYGGDVVKGEGAMLFANPHSAWVQNENQIRLMLHPFHLTIPGEIDVAGASFWSFPLPWVGFNKDVTWTILDAGQSVTAYVRQLMTVDTTGARPHYIMDGVRKPLEIRKIPIEVLNSDGSISVRTFEAAYSELGPLYKVQAGPGRPAGWYAYTDANEGSAFGLDQFLAATKARNVAEFVKAVEENRGVPSHLMAGDRHGGIAFVESVQTLAGSDELLRQCHVGGDSVLFNIVDGSRRDCAFRDTDGRPLRAPLSAYPNIFSRGIIHNTNNSYKYTEFGKVQENRSRFFGNPDVPEANIRHVMSARRMKEVSADGVVTPEEAWEVIFDNRNFAAEEWLDDILALCAGAVSADTKAGCAVLRNWDRKNNADSRGALLFHQFWNRLVAMKTVLPANNPVDLQVKRPLSITPETAPAIVEAIGASVRELAELGFSADAPWGQALYADTASGRIPVHGGSYQEGILNGEQPPKLEKGGFPYIMFGTSYAQFVRWEKGKMQADVLLTHGQTGTESEGRTTQMKMFANKQMYRFPFTQEELAKADIVKTTVLTLDARK